MDPSDALWLAEMGLESCIFMDQQCDLFMEEQFADVPEFESCFSQGSSSLASSDLINIPSTNSITSICSSPCQDSSIERPMKHLKPNNFSTVNPKLPNPAPTPIILSFGKEAGENPKLNTVAEAAMGSTGSHEEQLKLRNTKKSSRVRPPSQTYDHIIAERKRREQLSQRFITLSTIVPGLKKMDKTSVLGDAIKYLKHLEEKVKILEEQKTKQTMESVVLVKKSQIIDEEGESKQSLPVIEARVCHNHILLRVQCERQKGVLVKLLNKVEMLNLVILSTNVTPFGSFAIDITIIAEMEKAFNLTAKEVVKRFRAAI